MRKWTNGPVWLRLTSGKRAPVEARLHRCGLALCRSYNNPSRWVIVHTDSGLVWYKDIRTQHAAKCALTVMSYENWHGENVNALVRRRRLLVLSKRAAALVDAANNARAPRVHVTRAA